MVTVSRPRASAILARWGFGIALISWRYLWQIIPLYRSERDGDLVHDAPPTLPAATVDDELQLADQGSGPFFHRRFRVEITDASLSAGDVMRRVGEDFQRFVPSEVVSVRGPEDAAGPLRVGDEFVVEMPGPWNGPVRVVYTAETCLRLATLHGHLEAGQVQFRAGSEHGVLRFEIEAWARPSTPLVRWLYSVVRLAKEIQLNMWVRFCREVVATSGGSLRNGVHIDTLRLPAHIEVQGVAG